MVHEADAALPEKALAIDDMVLKLIPNVIADVRANCL
jgi:hypothetical protein